MILFASVDGVYQSLIKYTEFMSIYERGGDSRDVMFDRTLPTGHLMDDIRHPNPPINPPVTISQDSKTSIEAPEKFTPEQGKLINNLFTSGCMQFGEWKLTSGRTSPYKLDLAHAQHDPALTLMIAKEYEAAMRRKFVTAKIISPVPSASVPTISLVARDLGMPMMTVRIKEIDPETGLYPIDGFTQASVGQEAIVADDAGTTGGSIKKAVNALREKGVTVRQALVLLDRQEGAEEGLAPDKIELISIFKAEPMFEYARYARTAIGRPVCSEEQYQRFRSHIERYKQAK